MAIRIVIDSTADLTPKYQGKFDSVHLRVSFGDEEYIDGVTIDKKMFYEKLVSMDVVPKTSQATPAMFAEVFQKITDEGDSALVITLSSVLSGTYHSACIAAEDFPNIRVVDSLNVAVGSGILAAYAYETAKTETDLDMLTLKVLRKRDDVRILARVDTLEYLFKGGRLSRTAAIAGGILNIKPVLVVENGDVKVLGKARGSKKANNFLNEQIAKNGIDFSLPVMLGYTGNDDTDLKQYIEDSKALWEGSIDELEYTQICSVIGTHVGPGALAVAYFAKNTD